MSKKTLNQTNLESLGTEKLAALLMEVSTGSADIKRRLRLELSHNLGSAELAHEVRKRLASLRKSTSFVSWRKRKALVKDLSTQVAMIVDKIAPDDPGTAFDLLWLFVEIAPNTYERVDDSRGEVGDVFRTAIAHFDTLAPRALMDPEALADRVWGVIEDNGYGQWDGIITRLAPALGAAGLARLKSHVEGHADAPTARSAPEHEAFEFLRELRGGRDYIAERRARFVKSCLQEIATAAGDTTAYIAQYSDEDLKRKDVSAEVALIYLEEGQPEPALALLHDADQDDHPFGQEAWDNAYINVLAALGRDADAQSHRWSCFEARLDASHLRSYLKALPDFEDVEAEDRAKAHVLSYPDTSDALVFCLAWPDLLTAAQLVETRAEEMDGNRYDVLAPAADALRDRHPLAAVVLWRAMISYSLSEGRTSRYGYAAEHLRECADVDAQIADYGRFLGHAVYLEKLRSRHDRKTSFWAKFD